MLLALIGCNGCNKNGEEVPSAYDRMFKYHAVQILVDPGNAPFAFGAGIGVQGLDADLSEQIAAALGYEVKWYKETGGYNHMFEILKSGDAEIIVSAIAINPKWTRDFAFSKPYYDTGDVIAIPRNFIAEIKDLSGLSGKKVGVIAGRPGDSFMADQKTAKGVSITKFSSFDEALGALNRAEIDAVVGDEPMITYSSFNNYKNTVRLPKLINKYQYAAVVRKKETKLLETINATIDRLTASGELKKYDEKWFGTVRADADEKLQKDLEVEELKNKPKTIKVRLTKLSGAWPMDRLDGFVLVLNGPKGQYQSSPILTEGNKGTCDFTKPVPPGDYKLHISILKMDTDVPVPALAKSSLTMDMKFGGRTTVQFK